MLVDHQPFTCRAEGSLGHGPGGPGADDIGSQGSGSVIGVIVDLLVIFCRPRHATGRSGTRVTVCESRRAALFWAQNGSREVRTRANAPDAPFPPIRSMYAVQNSHGRDGERVGGRS